MVYKINIIDKFYPNLGEHRHLVFSLKTIQAFSGWKFNKDSIRSDLKYKMKLIYIINFVLYLKSRGTVSSPPNDWWENWGQTSMGEFNCEMGYGILYVLNLILWLTFWMGIYL